MRHEAVFNAKFFKAALETCKASRWQRFKARLCGQEMIVEDGGHRVTAYLYKGKLYMTNYEKPAEPEQEAK